MTEFVGGRKDNCRDLLYGTSPVHAWMKWENHERCRSE
jgi:hypothetical protein